MMIATRIRAARARGRELFPGLLASAVVAAAAAFLSQHYGAPAMLFALLLGMAMNFLGAEGRCTAGIGFSARSVLRIGVALLGLRITLSQVAAMGWQPLLLVVVSVTLTIGVSMVVARLFGFRGLFGLLTGGATAICGASAALALAAALPGHPLKERATLFTVIGVSALSTIAMIAYPMIVHALGLNPVQGRHFPRRYDSRRGTGRRRGLQHLARDRRRSDARQADARGDAATGDRVRGGAFAPHWQGRSRRRPATAAASRVRRAFAVLVLVNSTGWMPASVQELGNDASRWCLLAAMAAIGMKTQLREVVTVGIKPVVLMILETVFLALVVLGLMHWFG
jgi:uncharacterized membrane protein YadS